MAPSEPTIRRTVKSVDADEADVLVGRWLAEQVRAGRLAARQVPTFTALALDGKTLKGSWAEVNTGSGKVRLFSALVHREGVVVGQRTIPADTNELTQVVPLLDAVAVHRTEDGNGDLTGTVITAAALPVPDPIGIDSPPVSMARTCRACAGVSAERRHQGLWCLVRPS